MVEQDNILEYVYSFLNEVLPDKVYYSLNITERINLPFIVYQEISKKSPLYADDEYVFKRRVIQITLITKSKQIEIERRLENKFTENDIDYILVSEFFINEVGLHRVYEIKMEEFKYEQ